MSRCFPFPPPGYEKKARIDDLGLLKKEKHKEKKHKKEKKDKEKKESKEKREKEGRDGKHKEKKDKKEKHREKKKDKDKHRDKDKTKIRTEDQKAQAEDPNADKPDQKETKQNDYKGVLFEDKRILFEDKLTKQYAGNNGERVRENNHLAEESKDSKFLLELHRRIKDNDGGAGHQLVQKFTISDNRMDEETVRLVAKGSGPWSDGKEKLQDKAIDGRKIDGRGILAESRPNENATVQNHAGNFHRRDDEMPRPLEKNFDRTLEAAVEGKEKVKEKKDDKRGDKRKDKEKEKKGHGKDKDRDKEKKKEEKVKEQSEHKNREQNKLKENNTGLMGPNTFTQILKHSHENSVVGENLKKRKDVESNGVLHANDKWPSKLPKLSSSDPFTGNGRILEPCQVSLLNTTDRLGAATNMKVDNGRKINGVIEAPPSVVSSNKTPAIIVPADPGTEAPAKPPHPDTKYLSQVYSVPKTEEFSDFDDQEWLFGSNYSQDRKAVAKSSVVEDTPKVWAETMHIEPADIFALPYVIPY